MPIITNDGYNDVNLDQRRSSSIVPADTYYHQAPPDQQKLKNAMEFAQAAERLGSSIQSATAQIGNAIKSGEAEKEKNDLMRVDDMVASIRAEQADGVPQAVQANPMLAEMSTTAQARVNEHLGALDAKDRLSAIQEEYAQSGLWNNPEGSKAFFAAKDKEAAEMASSQPFYGGSYYKHFSSGLQALSHHAATQRAGEYQKMQFEDMGNQYIQGVVGQYDSRNPQEPGVSNTAPYNFVDGKAVSAAVEQAKSQLPTFARGTNPADIASSMSGADEQRNNIQVRAFLAKGGHELNPSQSAWCAAFVGSCLEQAGIKPLTSNVATSYLKWGQGVDATSAQKGDVVVLDRGLQAGQTGGHIGIATGRVDGNGNIEYISGNQDNKVTTTWVAGDKVNVRRGTPETSAGAMASSPAQSVNTVVNRIIGVESKGDPTAQNRNSSAGGLGQFTDSTWLASVKTYAPEMKGKSDAEILAMKKDSSPEGVAFQQKILTGFTKRNASVVASVGAEVTPGNIYLVHFAGEGGGKSLLKASDGTKVEQVLSPDAVKANPFLRGKTVGELKQWAAEKMGQPYHAEGAAQNFSRGLDREWGASSGLGNVMRRDAMAKAAVDYALKTGDTRPIDAFPPELVTPGIQANFESARRHAQDFSYQKTQREAHAKKVAEEEQTETLIQSMNEKILRNEPINPGIDARNQDGSVNNKAVEWARTHQWTDMYVNPDQSASKRMNMEEDISLAYSKGDFKSLGFEKEPSKKELRDAIWSNKEMRHEDKDKLIKHLDKTIQLGQVVDAPDTNRVYKTYVGTFLDVVEKNMMVSLENKLGNPTEFKSKAREFFEENVRLEMKALADSYPDGIPASERSRVLKTVAKETIDHVKLLTESVSKGSSADKPDAAKPLTTQSGKKAEATKDAEGNIIVNYK